MEPPWKVVFINKFICGLIWKWRGLQWEQRCDSFCCELIDDFTKLEKTLTKNYDKLLHLKLHHISKGEEEEKKGWYKACWWMNEWSSRSYVSTTFETCPHHITSNTSSWRHRTQSLAWTGEREGEGVAYCYIAGTHWAAYALIFLLYSCLFFVSMSVVWKGIRGG